MDEYFEKGYHIDRYHALEEDLLTFLDYVTLEFYPKPQNRKYIKSIYLADLMLRIGSNIGIFFDQFIERYLIQKKSNIQQNLLMTQDSCKIAEELKKKKIRLESKGEWRGWNMGDYKKLDPILNLSNLTVSIIPLNEDLCPFRYDGKKESKSWTEINEKDTEFWWNSHNKIKHTADFERANLNNVLQSLAALFLLITKSGTMDSKKLTQYNYYKRDYSGTILAFDVSTRLFSRNTWE